MYQAIRLAPQMNRDTAVRVFNENFALAENYTDLYKKVGIYEFPSVAAIAAFGSTTQTITIPHNSNAIVRYDVFVENHPWTNGGTIPAINSYHVTPVNWNTATFYSVSGSVTIAMTYYIGLDETNLYIFRNLQNTTASVQTAPTAKMYYFIQREPI